MSALSCQDLLGLKHDIRREYAPREPHAMNAQPTQCQLPFHESYEFAVSRQNPFRHPQDLQPDLPYERRLNKDLCQVVLAIWAAMISCRESY